MPRSPATPIPQKLLKNLPATRLGRGILMLFLLFSSGVKRHFGHPEPTPTTVSASPQLLSGLKAQLANITGILVQMPNKNYISSYLDSLSSSQNISIQTYELTEKTITSRIKQKALSGTKFRIMLENQKYQQFQNTFKKLTKDRANIPNIQLKSDEHLPTTYLHSKITLADSGFWIQSSNLTHSTFANNREHLFRSQNPEILKSLTTLFEKDFAGEPLLASDLHPNLVVCNINCRAIITSLLSWAQKSITIQTQYLTDPALFDLIATKSQSLQLRAIFSATDNNQSLPDFFGRHQVRLLKKPYIHTKMILIDDEILLLGSMNLSANSLDHNREIWILLIDPPLIQAFKQQFTQDRAKAQ